MNGSVLTEIQCLILTEIRCDGSMEVAWIVKMNGLVWMMVVMVMVMILTDVQLVLTEIRCLLTRLDVF